MHKSRLFFFSISIALGACVLSLLKGSTPLNWQQLWASDVILLKLRLPRTLTAFVSGGLLALAGSLMQLLLQNPLADPYILGISGGAALATLAMMFFGFSEHWLMAGAWLGSLAAITLIFTLSKQHRWQTNTLLLCGIAIACGLSACISFILLISSNANLHNMLFWLSGDLNDANFPWLACAILLISIGICLLLAPGLNLLSRGEKEARALGLQTERYRCALYLLSSLLTATAVTLAGCIGFIGLIIPHVTRLLAGFDQRIILPLAVLFGGTLLTIADTCARSLFAPQQIPVGIMMALIGVPTFIWLLQK